MIILTSTFPLQCRLRIWRIFWFKRLCGYQGRATCFQNKENWTNERTNNTAKHQQHPKQVRWVKNAKQAVQTSNNSSIGNGGSGSFSIFWVYYMVFCWPEHILGFHLGFCGGIGLLPYFGFTIWLFADVSILHLTLGSRDLDCRPTSIFWIWSWDFADVSISGDIGIPGIWPRPSPPRPPPPAPIWDLTLGFCWCQYFVLDLGILLMSAFLVTLEFVTLAV